MLDTTVLPCGSGVGCSDDNLSNGYEYDILKAPVEKTHHLLSLIGDSRLWPSMAWNIMSPLLAPCLHSQRTCQLPGTLTVQKVGICYNRASRHCAPLKQLMGLSSQWWQRLVRLGTDPATSVSIPQKQDFSASPSRSHHLLQSGPGARIPSNSSSSRRQQSLHPFGLFEFLRMSRRP